MKTLLFITGILWANFSHAQKRVDLETALNQGMISLTITGRETNPEVPKLNSTFYGGCMLFMIKNLTKQDLIVEIKSGLMLMSEDTTVQNMIVTKDRTIKLSPQINTELVISAMCTEIHDASPFRSNNYYLGKMAKTPMIILADQIELLNQQNNIGQIAMWAYANKATINEVSPYIETTTDIQEAIAILDDLHLPHNLAKSTNNKAESKHTEAKTIKTLDEAKVNAVNHTDTTNATVAITMISKKGTNNSNNTTVTLNSATQPNTSFWTKAGIGIVFGLPLFWFLFLLFRRKKEKDEETPENFTPRLQRV